MLLRITFLWFLGMVTIVPYAVYQLFFHATKDEMAFLIVIPFFWIFGFWGVVGPLVSAWKIFRIMNALDGATSAETQMKIIQSQDTENVIIDGIAADNHIPKFLARIIYKKMLEKLKTENAGNESAG